MRHWLRHGRKSRIQNNNEINYTSYEYKLFMLRSPSYSYLSLDPHFASTSDSHKHPNIHPKMSFVFVQNYTCHALETFEQCKRSCTLVMRLEDVHMVHFSKGVGINTTYVLEVGTPCIVGLFISTKVVTPPPPPPPIIKRIKQKEERQDSLYHGKTKVLI